MILILLPFINKAFYIDDPLFLWTAQQIQKHPFDFYGFPVNWYINEKPMFDVAKNPPLASYYIAGIASLFGYRGIPLHIGFILPAAMVAVGTFCLARRFCSNPLLAALIAVLNPVFLVSATTLMCDTMMLAFWVWALFFWIRAMETQKHRYFLLAAILSVFCAMTKYFGIALIPLTIVYSLAQKRRFGRWTFYWFLPIAAIALYQWWTFSLYGRGLLSDAFSYSAEEANWTTSQLLHKIPALWLLPVAVSSRFFSTATCYGPKERCRRGLLGQLFLSSSCIFSPLSAEPRWVTEGNLDVT